MAKKKQQIQVTAGNRFICPSCSLQFRHYELMEQHLAHGCKPVKSDGPTWSEENIEDKPQE